jgi:hypothetical protein
MLATRAVTPVSWRRASISCTRTCRPICPSSPTMYSRARALAGLPTGRLPIVPASMLTWARAFASTNSSGVREQPRPARAPVRGRSAAPSREPIRSSPGGPRRWTGRDETEQVGRAPREWDRCFVCRRRDVSGDDPVRAVSLAGRRGQRHAAGVERHAHHRVDADRVELVDLLHRGDPAGGDDLARRRAADRRDGVHVGALQHPLAVHVRVQERAEERLELTDGLHGGQGQRRAPAVNHDLTALAVHGGDQAGPVRPPRPAAWRRRDRCRRT